MMYIGTYGIFNFYAFYTNWWENARDMQIESQMHFPETYISKCDAGIL